MKQILLIAFVITATLLACKKSSTTYTQDCSGSSKSYKNDVSPIMTSYCNTSSGCHASGSSRGPGALTSYSAVYAAKSSIRSSVSSGSMPQGSTLTAAQKNAILCWIDQGASNN